MPVSYSNEQQTVKGVGHETLTASPPPYNDIPSRFEYGSDFNFKFSNVREMK